MKGNKHRVPTKYGISRKNIVTQKALSNRRKQ